MLFTDLDARLDECVHEFPQGLGKRRMAGLEAYREGLEPGCVGRAGRRRSTATHGAFDVLYERAELLTRLAVERCVLDKPAVKLAKQIGRFVDVERQREWPDWADAEWRYAAVGE